VPHRRSKVPCRPGSHRYRGREHAQGCDFERTGHYCIRCRVCVWRWAELMLFDVRQFEEVTP
jgi:hypothetical protein